MDIPRALLSLRPNAIFSLLGNDYDDIVWGDENELEIPSKEEVLNEARRIDEQDELNKYQWKRSLEYPRIEEQLDLLYHGGLDAWREEINKVKEKYPKPEGS